MALRDLVVISILPLYHHSYMKHYQVQDFKFNTPWSQRSCRQIPWTDDKWSIYSEIRILFLIHVTGLEL